MSRIPEHFKGNRVDYLSPSTRRAFKKVEQLAKEQHVKDWLQHMERAIMRSDMRDVGERNTVILIVGSIFLALELVVVKRLVDAKGVLIQIKNIFMPLNSYAAEVAYQDQRASWYAAHDSGDADERDVVRLRSMHRVAMRFFGVVAEKALNCRRNDTGLGHGWSSLIQRYTARVVDQGRDEGMELEAMKKFIRHRQDQICAA